jgi:hypothetical protein
MSLDQPLGWAVNGGGFGNLFDLKSGTSKALTTSLGYRNGGTMNGLLAICSICEIIS